MPQSLRTDVFSCFNAIAVCSKTSDQRVLTKGRIACRAVIEERMTSFALLHAVIDN